MSRASSASNLTGLAGSIEGGALASVAGKSDRGPGRGTSAALSALLTPALRRAAETAGGRLREPATAALEAFRQMEVRRGTIKNNLPFIYHLRYITLRKRR
jgi:hypothetical protein